MVLDIVSFKNPKFNKEYISSSKFLPPSNFVFLGFVQTRFQGPLLEFVTLGNCVPVFMTRETNMAVKMVVMGRFSVVSRMIACS